MTNEDGSTTYVIKVTGDYVEAHATAANATQTYLSEDETWAIVTTFDENFQNNVEGMVNHPTIEWAFRDYLVDNPENGLVAAMQKTYEVPNQ